MKTLPRASVMESHWPYWAPVQSHTQPVSVSWDLSWNGSGIEAIEIIKISLVCSMDTDQQKIIIVPSASDVKSADGVKIYLGCSSL